MDSIPASSFSLVLLSWVWLFSPRAAGSMWSHSYLRMHVVCEHCWYRGHRGWQCCWASCWTQGTLESRKLPDPGYPSEVGKPECARCAHLPVYFLSLLPGVRVSAPLAEAGAVRVPRRRWVQILVRSAFSVSLFVIFIKVVICFHKHMYALMKDSAEFSAHFAPQFVTFPRVNS